MLKVLFCVNRHALYNGPMLNRALYSRRPTSYLISVITTLKRSMSNTVTVTVSQGQLRGKQATSKTGQTFYSFQGVPYAKPPVGPLRFMAPQPPEPWIGVRDAYKEGNVCPHKDMFFQNLVGDEDCLFLNVYTSKVQAMSDKAPKAVMVWFHGGGFNVGHGNSDLYGPDFLLNEDVVLVTLNYRIGALGFLSMSKGGVSGNAGLKDQVAALRWVKQNISTFGGDPNNVTIFGESAGGACVQYHLLSPMSAGLFHRAISQSGSALSWWALVSSATAEHRAFTLGKVLGSAAKSPQEMIEYLRLQPAYAIVKSMGQTTLKERRPRGDLFPFVPVVESGNDSDEEIFLADTPQNLIKAGRIHPVPYMIGVNSHEGIYMLKDVISDPKRWSTIDQGFENLISLDINVRLNTEQSRDVAHKIRSFYFQGKPVSRDTRESYVNLISDTWFGLAVDRSVKEHTAFSTAPVYYFQFSYGGELGFFKNLFGANHLPGACHGDELGYLFCMSMLDHAELDPQSPAILTLKRMVQMWTNFAKTGNPTPEATRLLQVNWEPATATNINYLDIGSELELKCDRAKDRMQFWKELYEEVGRISPTCQL